MKMMEVVQLMSWAASFLEENKMYKVFFDAVAIMVILTIVICIKCLVKRSFSEICDFVLPIVIGDVIGVWYLACDLSSLSNQRYAEVISVSWLICLIATFIYELARDYPSFTLLLWIPAIFATKNTLISLIALGLFLIIFCLFALREIRELYIMDKKDNPRNK